MFDEELGALIGENDKAAQIKDLVRRELDRSVSKGINSFKEKFETEKLPGLIDEAVKERTKKDPEKILSLKERAFQFAIDNKLDPAFATKHLIGNDEGETDAKLADFQETVNGLVLAEVEKRLKKGSGPPPSHSGPGIITRIDLQRMSPGQIAEAFKAGKLNSMLGAK